MPVAWSNAFISIFSKKTILPLLFALLGLLALWRPDYAVEVVLYGVGYLPVVVEGQPQPSGL